MPKKVTKKKRLKLGFVDSHFADGTPFIESVPTKSAESIEEVVQAPVALRKFDQIAELTESFSNGELNILKEKINEIIKRIN